jgi:O-antigen/teichoic acid export membrane protein
VSGSFPAKKDTNHEAISQVESLSTGHLLEDIGTRAVSSGLVTVSAQAAKFFLNFAAAAVLARLLTPREFGLVGMVLGITGLVGLFKELGLSTATVQRDIITQQQVSNLFWVNVCVSGILTGLCFGLAPLVASFYHDPRVKGIMMALSLTFLVSGSTVQHQALLARQMRFRAIAKIELISMLLGFTSACCLAKVGFGYWALVAQQLAAVATNLVLTWYTSGWRPSMPTRNSGVGPMLSFGAHLTMADFLGLLMANSDSILVGRVFGAEPLGLYTRANVLLARPLQQVLAPINAVLTPVLSRLQNDTERYRRSFMHAYETLALITFSFSAMCLVLASPLILVVLGPKWKDVIPLFSAFAVVAVSWPLGEAAVWLFQSQGRGREQLHNHTLGGAVTLASYVIGLHWGPLGVVVLLAITSMAIRLPIVYYFAGRSGPVATSDLWRAFWSHLPCWGTVCLATTLAFRIVKDAAPIIQLLVCGPIGLGAGVALVLILDRPRQSALYAWNTVRSSLVHRWSSAKPSYGKQYGAKGNSEEV